MLDHDHADRRPLRDLMTTEPPTRPALIRGELPATATARTGIATDDLIHPILGLEPPARAAMTKLSTRLTLTLLAQQLLRLRPGLRPTC